MDDERLAEVYFQTTLELRDSSGQLYLIRPTTGHGGDPRRLLSPYTDAFILTAENPLSLDEFSESENREATEALRDDLNKAGVVFQDCPGRAIGSDHVEAGFALLATDRDRDQLLLDTLDLARSYRQNAIFHLNKRGLHIIGAVRHQMSGHRPVRIERAGNFSDTT